jgi:hypothetical protein
MEVVICQSDNEIMSVYVDGTHIAHISYDENPVEEACNLVEALLKKLGIEYRYGDFEEFE